MKELKGKTALVTGVARGMGCSLSQLLINEGCKVAMVDIDSNGLDEAVKMLSDVGECRGFVCDISDETEVVKLSNDISNSLGDISVLVNNAGIVRAAPVTELKERDVALMFDVNITALFRMCRIFIPQMKSLGKGHIVNVASAGGILAIPNLSAYAATKFGVIGFSDALRQEMKKEKANIEVTYVCPNTVSTGMFNGSKMVNGTNMLTPEMVIKQIIKAVKKNRPMCAVPWFSLRIAIPLMKLVLSINTMDNVNKKLGMWTINDSWKGRDSL